MPDSAVQTFHANLAALVADKARQEPDTRTLTFVTVEPDGSLSDETRTYRQLYDNAQALARGLKRLGLRRGATFAIMMNNHPEFVEAMLAASILGAVFVPIDARTMGEKLEYMLAFAECEGVVCADYCQGQVIDVAPAVKGLKWMLVAGEASSTAPAGLQVLPYRSALDPGAPLAIDEPSPDDRMYMMYTSGTTGNPKAVVISHGKTMAPLRGLANASANIHYTGLSLTHINAMSTLTNGLASSTPVVISRKFTKSRLWDICRAYDCTVFNLLGGMIPELYSVPEKPDDADNPVRMIISAGMPPALWTAYEQRFGVKILELYGSTEAGGSLFNRPGEGPIGSCGKPPPGQEAAIFNENNERCAPGEWGELRFRRTEGPDPTVEYYKNEGASTAKVIDGWFLTGDIAHMDEDGWVFFHHRIGGGVRRNGDFISTALVESVITRSDMVDDVFVYGVATEANVAGEKTLVASVVPRPGAGFSEAALLAYCRQHLQRSEVPEILHVTDAIPKTVSEKPIERACIALLEEAGLVAKR